RHLDHPLPAHHLPCQRRQAHRRIATNARRFSQQVLRQQRVAQVAPLLRALRRADAIDRELVMSALDDGFRLSAAQHLDDIAKAEALVGARDGGEQLLRVYGAILALGWVQAVVARAAVLLSQRLAEVGEQATPPTVAIHRPRQHALELLPRDGLLVGVAHLSDEVFDLGAVAWRE